MTPTLETARLVLRPLEVGDAAATQRLFPHMQIVRYLAATFPWPYPGDGALSYYRDVALPAVAAGLEWHWSLRLKSAPGEHIGAIALAANESDNRGFWLGLPWHRHGLMTEAVEAATNFWFESLRKPMMRVNKAAGNEASRRISQAEGMRLVACGEKQFVGGLLPLETWEITAEEWLQRRARRSGSTASDTANP